PDHGVGSSPRPPRQPQQLRRLARSLGDAGGDQDHHWVTFSTVTRVSMPLNSCSSSSSWARPGGSALARSSSLATSSTSRIRSSSGRVVTAVAMDFAGFLLPGSPELLSLTVQVQYRPDAYSEYDGPGGIASVGDR